MEEKPTETIEKAKKETARPTVSTVLPDGSLVEMVCQESRTLFCVSKDGAFRYEPSLLVNGQSLVPYSPRNNLLTNEVVMFPSEPSEYASESKLVEDIRAFIHRYVDISPLFEQIASYYVLFTWVYDAFNELPYLRLRGDTGSGKTRFLLTVGSLCYKPIFASGASTVSPLFRILDSMRGTLIVDEGDFRFSDEKAELVKILNNGNGRGFPVLRSESVSGRELRDDIPINLTGDYKREALELRNKLLMFRFRSFGKRQIDPALADRSIEPRLAQIFVPLLSVIEDAGAREALRQVAREYHKELVADRGMDIEAQVLEIIQELQSLSDGGGIAIKEIASRFIEQHGEDFERKVTPHWVGHIVRKKLQLKTEKRHGSYVIASSEGPKLVRLFEKYGVSNGQGDLGDSGD